MEQDHAPDQGSPRMGVVVVTYQAESVIGNCLASLFASRGVALSIVVIDNASRDASRDVVREHGGAELAECAVGATPPDRAPPLTLLNAPRNGGYGHAVNRGLEYLLHDEEIELFWVLNPDCVVAPDTAAHYARAGADGQFALMGGRTAYVDPAGVIQSDGGRISRRTGVCSLVNGGRPVAGTSPPDAGTLDFISGANMVASRAFIARAGLMAEDYFLYYEEVDWAFRRGELPLRFVGEALVRHHAGSAIGSGSTTRRHSAFANYFIYRSRMRFLWRFAPLSLPLGLAHAIGKAMQLAIVGAPREAEGVLRGVMGFPPPRAVSQRLGLAG